MNEFYNNLMQLRKQQGWSQEQLGVQINVSRQTISKWELGSTTPELSKIIELSQLFQISIDELVGEKELGGCDLDEGRTLQRKYFSNRIQYEYISKFKIGKLPLIHINIGSRKGQRQAKGVIAIGTVAIGVIAIGFVSIGVLSFGLLSFGMLAIATLSFGGIALGAISIGIISMGAVALGMYTTGACAIGTHIALGGYANAPIAIGDYTTGTFLLDINQSIEASEVRSTILKKFPNTITTILNYYTSFFK